MGLKPLVISFFTGFYLLSIDIMCFACLLQSFHTKRQQVFFDSRVFFNIVMS